MSRERNLPIPARLWAPVVLMVAAVALPSCSGKSPYPGGTPVAITLRDFKMTPAQSAANPGDVRFEVYNKSPVTHEFVVVRSDLPADALPLGADGLSVDEDQVDVVAELGEVVTRDTAILALGLPPGRYVFFCNLEGHYLGGMHGALKVSDA
jgi:uncharacterized cupredoxin-like copper-binding protein